MPDVPAPLQLKSRWNGPAQNPMENECRCWEEFRCLTIDLFTLIPWLRASLDLRMGCSGCFATDADILVVDAKDHRYNH